jgi:hypothetical protein
VGVALEPVRASLRAQAAAAEEGGDSSKTQGVRATAFEAALLIKPYAVCAYIAALATEIAAAFQQARVFYGYQAATRGYHRMSSTASATNLGTSCGRL